MLQYGASRLLPAKTVYLPLDDPYFTGTSLLDAVHLLRDRGIRNFLLDEVHRYPNWSRDLKVAYDRYPDVRLVATGSSVSDLTRGDADLSRRAIVHTLNGLSWREYLRLTGAADLQSVDLKSIVTDAADVVALVTAAVESPVASFGEYLRVGYFPFFLEDDVGYLPRVRQAALVAIDLDLANAADVTAETVRKLKRLLSLIAAGVPYVPNLNTVAQQLGTSRKQIYRLLDLLEQAMLIRRLWSRGRSPKGLAKPEKIYLDNPNLAHALADADIGNLRETAFVAAVQPHHEIGSGKGVDFAVGAFSFEVGGPNKTRRQGGDIPDAYRVLDDTELAYGDVLPLYLFGLLG